MMSIERFIELYEKGAMDEQALEQMEHFVFEAGDDELFIAAQIYSSLGLTGKAVALVEPLLEKYPAETNLKTFLADQYLDLAEDDKAMEVLADMGENGGIQGLLLEADMYTAQGLFEVAEAKIKEAMAMEPDNELVQLALGEFYFHIGDFEKALGYYLALKDVALGLELNVFDRLATCFSQVGEFEKALEQLGESEKFFGALNTDQLFNQAFLAYGLGDYSTARRSLQDLKALDDSYDTLYPLLAKVHLAEKDLDQALEAIEAGISFNEFSHELQFLKGTILEAMKDIEGARDAYYEALNLDPEDLESALRSNRICLAMEDFEEVVANVAHFEESGLTDLRFAWDLAIAQQELEEYEEAAARFETARLSFGENVEFLMDYSAFLIEEGRRQEAGSHLEKILSIEPGNLQASQLLEEISS